MSADDVLREKLLGVSGDTSSSQSFPLSTGKGRSIHDNERQSFDFTFVRRLWNLLRVTHKTLFDWLWLIALVLILSIQLLVGSYIGEANKGFYDAFAEKNAVGFRDTLWRASLIVVGSAMLETVSKIISSILAWRWRRSIVNKLHSEYFSSKMFYKLLNYDERVDNPYASQFLTFVAPYLFLLSDQRITQDVDNLTTTLAQIVSDVLTGPMTIGYYTWLTWVSIGWYAPAIVFGYFFVSYIISKIIMGPIVNRVFRQERLEGDFRFGHVRVRTNAEAIAIYGGESIEREHMNSRFGRVLANRLSLIKWDFLLISALLRFRFLMCHNLILPSPRAVNNIFTYFGSMVSFMILAIPMLNGWPLNISSVGAVALAAFQVIMLISGWSKFNNVSQKVSDVAGYASRVGQMLDVMESLRSYRPDRSIYDGMIMQSIPSAESPSGAAVPLISAESEELSTRSSDFALEFSAVSIWTPRERQLVRNLRLQLREGERLLIMGPSGCGKSTVLRTIAGMWPFFSGTIRRPGIFSEDSADPRRVLCLHQSPFLTSGTLKDQIVYPSNAEDTPLSDEKLREILSLLDLGYLLQEQERRYTTSLGDVRVSLKDRSNREWIELLSPGEQQRLCLGRVLFWRPRYIFLDEASSAIDFEVEKAFYQFCKTLNSTIVSVGHSETLKRYHGVLLRLKHDGKWNLSNLDL